MPGSYALMFCLLGFLFEFIHNTVFSESYNFVTVFFYAASGYCTIIFLIYILRTKKQSIVLTDSKLQIDFEKNSLEIPLSSISEVEICDSPIIHKVGTIFDATEVWEAGKVMKISLKVISESQLEKVFSKLKPLYFPSQIIHISKNHREVSLKAYPSGGFRPLLEAINEHIEGATVENL